MPVSSKNFTVTITSIHEDDAIGDVTHTSISASVRSFDYEAVLPDPAVEYDDEDGDVIASEEEFDDEDEEDHDAAADEALETLQDLISPEQLLTLSVLVSPAMIADLKAVYEAQDVNASSEVLVTYYSDRGEPLFYHIFMGYINPVRKLAGGLSGESNMLTVELEMDIDEVRTFCLECPSAAKPMPLADSE